ncbi:minor structural protein [uncultured Mediterranean phage]|nr:minor structural protein [uncultured Mediterranean phage]
MAIIKTNARSASALDATILTGNIPALNGSAVTNLTSGNLTGALPAISGASLTTLNATNISSGTLNAARYSGGKVLQIQHTKNTTYRNVQTDSFTSCITVTITPASSSNTILVLGACFVGAGAVDTSCHQRLIRVVGGSDVATQQLNDITGYSGNSERFEGTGSAFQWHDSPATTSAVTYDFRICSEADINGAHYNNYLTDGNQSSQITAMEISA